MDLQTCVCVRCVRCVTVVSVKEELVEELLVKECQRVVCENTNVKELRGKSYICLKELRGGRRRCMRK